MTKEQEKLVTDNTSLIYGVINDMHLGFRVDDFYDIGCIALCKAAINYNSEFENKFSSYAYNCIHNEITNEVKAENRQKRIKDENIVSYDNKYKDDEENSFLEMSLNFSYLDDNFSEFEIKELLKTIFSDSDVNYKLAVYLIIEDMKLVDAKNKLNLNISHQAMQQRRNTILRRLSKLREMI